MPKPRKSPQPGRSAAGRTEPRKPAWLLFVHQLPSRPSNVRVSTWRRLQDVGAVAVKNSVYVLPNSPQAQEDLEWIKGEVVSMKGQATVFAADNIDSLSYDEIVAAFRRMRQEDYRALQREIRALFPRAGRKRPIANEARNQMAHRLQVLHKQKERISSIDYFGAPGREETLAALRGLEELLTDKGPTGKARPAEGEALDARAFSKRLWITRPRPGIDRIASAWLIRRFIDPGAKFGFVERPDDVPSAVPFDMFGVEFSHQGNDCTFETLAGRFDLQDPGVEWLGRVVHNLDLKDDRYAVPEAPGIGSLLAGLQQIYSDDQEMLEQGITAFEALHRSSAIDRAPARRSTRPARRRRRKGQPARKPRGGK